MWKVVYIDCFSSFSFPHTCTTTLKRDMVTVPGATLGEYWYEDQWPGIEAK